MKFSVLLPTRNGGRFLRDCIKSVLSLCRSDVEMVVADNASTDETGAILAEFRSDSRLKYVRSEMPLSVTDNWNAALAASSGDYVLMMGDDDYLLPGYFSAVDRVIDEYHNPDCITYNGYTYAFPNSIAGNASSYYADPHFRFGPEFSAGPMSRSLRQGVVRDMFRFRVRFPLNMQLTLVSRRAADSIPGGMFRPPFPDHYALNSLLLLADSFVFLPRKLVVVGVSPKSFGHYAYSGKQDQGMEYLGSHSHFPGHLPGNEMINSMYRWLNLLQTNYREQLPGVSISRVDYVRHQVFAWYLEFRVGALSIRDVVNRSRALTLGDWLGLSMSPFNRKYVAAFPRLLMRGKRDQRRASWPGLKRVDHVADIAQFAAWVSERGTCC